MNPRVEYTIYEVTDFFEDRIEAIKSELKDNVEKGLMEPIHARKILDMYLSAQIHLKVSIALTEEEKIRGDFKYTERKQKAKGERSAVPDLQKAGHLLYG